MKIISQFKDYYDYIGKQYGEDPRIIYFRRDLSEPSGQINSLLVPYSTYMKVKNRYVINEKAVVVVCGEPFIVERQRFDSAVPFNYSWSDKLTNEEFGDRYFEDVPTKSWKYATPEVFLTVERRAAIRNLAIRSVKLPVFILLADPGSSYRCRVGGRVPRLDRIEGLPALLPPEKIWQDIAYFIGNEIHDNPDGVGVVPPRSDAQKAASHGFDARRSFRPKMR